MKRSALLLLVIFPFLFSCKSGRGLFGAKRLHEQYAQKLRDAGLHETALGQQWFRAADNALNAPQSITLPYREVGYFAAERPRAAGLRFSARRGQKLLFQVEKNPAAGFALYVELWRVTPNSQPSFVRAADSTLQAFEQEVDGDESYILRLQPELLRSGDYTLSISIGPSMAYPVPGGRVGSVWGDPRDGGARRHEGIDIFAPRRTPVVAIADGVVTSVREGGIGGKVVFMRPSGKSYNLYYAHLDEQLVSNGQRVSAGDTIGLLGNTGNAATTSPHLHFGIYAAGGAIDPLPFVNPTVQRPAAVNLIPDRLQTPHRATADIRLGNRSYGNNSIVFPLAVSARNYRVELPDGSTAEVAASAVQPASGALRQGRTKNEAFLLDAPRATAGRKQPLQAATAVTILGYFDDFAFVQAGDEKGWIPGSLL